MICFSAEPFSIDHVDVYGGGVDGGGEGDEDDGDYDLSQCSSSRCRETLAKTFVKSRLQNSTTEGAPVNPCAELSDKLFRPRKRWL